MTTLLMQLISRSVDKKTPKLMLRRSLFYSCRPDSHGGWLASRVVSVLDLWVQIAAATLSGNSLRQTVHTHCASVNQTAKLVSALLKVARVTAGLAESNGSLPSGLWLTSPAGWLQRIGYSSGTLSSVIKYGPPLPLDSHGCGRVCSWQ